jgi:hypothetical protein
MVARPVAARQRVTRPIQPRRDAFTISSVSSALPARLSSLLNWNLNGWSDWRFWAQRLDRAARALTTSEWAFAALLLLCYGYFIEPAGTNTISRWDMVYALAHGGANIDIHACNTIDVSYYLGHWYSPRSLGLSLFAVPVLAALGHFVDLNNASFCPGNYSVGPGAWTITNQVALISFFTVVPVTIAACLVLRRFIAELRPALANSPLSFVVTGIFGLATLFYPFTTTFFSHTVGGALLLIGFYFLYRARAAERPTRHIVWAGVFTGLGVISEYPAGVIFLVLCGYILLAFPGQRIKTLFFYGLGVLPSALVLAWYNWYAFGNPFNLSYGFVTGDQFNGQHTGFFGINLPTLSGLWQILVYPRGLLIESPFLIFVPLGLYLWYRSKEARPEALVVIAVSVIYPLLVSSYFLPMAGENLPGPRLLLPALPFACMGLAWVIADSRKWLRGTLMAMVGFALVITFLYVVAGVRIYHNYGAYPVTDLYIPVLTSAQVPVRDGPTPQNIGELWLRLPPAVSLYVVAAAMSAWYYAALRAVFSFAKPTPATPAIESEGSDTGATSDVDDATPDRVALSY